MKCSSLSSASTSSSSTTTPLPFVTTMGANPPIIKLKVQSKRDGEDGASMLIGIHASQITNEQHELSYEMLVDLASKYARISPDDLRLTYVDEEGDVMTILSNEGLAMAMEEPSAGRRYIRMSTNAAKLQNHVGDVENEGKSTEGFTMAMTVKKSPVKDIDSANWKQYGMDLPCRVPSDFTIECVSFSSDGNIMAVGSPYNNSIVTCSGLVRVYKRHEGGWMQLGDDIKGSDENGRCGWSTSLSSNGQVLAVGLPGNRVSRGCVRVYELMNQQWAQKGDDIVGKADDDLCGWSVSLSSDGANVAIGSVNNSDSGFLSGHVRVYEHGTNGWTQRGNTIGGNRAYDRCGLSVSLSSDGNVLAIGSPINNDNGSCSGHVRVFKYDTGVWSQRGRSIIGNAGDRCGKSVSLSSDGNTVAIGSPDFAGDGNHRTGRARVFEYASDDEWVQRGDDIVGKYEGSRCGWSVSLSSDGKMLVVGSPYSSFNGQPRCGLVEVLRFVSSGWSKIGSNITGKVTKDYCGSIVSISSDGKMLAVGSPGIVSNGHVRVYTL